MKITKEEIISIVNDEFKSNIEDDWDGQFINLNEYWVNKLKYNNQLIHIKNIKDYKLFDYITKADYLMDYYEFEDSSCINDLVPSMIYRYNPLNEDDWIWVGFPNSNNLDEDNEEWNNFTLMICRNTAPEEIFQFENIEDILGFIKSNVDLISK